MRGPWRGSANLWYTVAKALGFMVATIHCPDHLFVSQVALLCAGVKALAPLSGRFCRPSHLSDIVCLDVSGFPTGPGTWRS